MEYTQDEWILSHTGKAINLKNGTPIAQAWELDLPKEQAEANAKLIAAAPDLLRQLIIAVKHIKNIEAKYKPEQSFAIGEYEAAIKKATE